MLTSTKIGRLLGLSKKTVLDLAREGRIPSILLPSGHRRFDAAEVKAALKDTQVSMDADSSGAAMVQRGGKA